MRAIDKIFNIYNKIKKIHLVVKVRLILVFPPPTHPETKVWDVGPL